MYSWLEFNKEVLQSNYQLFSDLIGADKLAPVLKSNAYGHGFNETYEVIKECDPSWICVNYIEEAKQLRSLGYKRAILIVGPTPPENIADVHALDASIFLNSKTALDAWLALNNKPKAHVKFDTGMSRQGFFLEEAESVAKWLSPHKHAVEGICSHFANVEDVTEHGYANQQIAEFKNAIEVLGASGIKGLNHIASSASALILKESRMDLGRIGISFYGFWPSNATKLSYLKLNDNLLPIKPALSWYARVSQVKSIKKGRYIGYGCTYRAPQDIKIAVLPIGYYEGFGRLAGQNGAHVLIDGSRCPVVGRVCMNMTMVDVSHLQSVKAGDLVTILGGDGDEAVSGEDFAAWSQTIHYEAVTRINSQLSRRII